MRPRVYAREGRIIRRTILHSGHDIATSSIPRHQTGGNEADHAPIRANPLRLKDARRALPGGPGVFGPRHACAVALI